MLASVIRAAGEGLRSSQSCPAFMDALPLFVVSDCPR